jgi:vitamin B12 transporter
MKPQSLMKVGAFFIHHHPKEEVRMKQLIKFILCFFPIVLSYGMPPDAGGDSTRIYHADDVVVTATRSTVSFADTPSPIQVISAESIKGINGKTVADVLRNVNSIAIKDYGAVAGTKNAAFRGLSTENILLLFDGVPINDPQYGSMDLSLLPLDAVDRIEISYGGSSALYGGNALGGVVNILSRHATNDIHARIYGEGGSFNAQRMTAEMEGRFVGLGLIGGIARETGDDSFPFIWHRQNRLDTTLYRRNADYKRTNIFVNGDYQLAKELALSSSIQYVKFERGVPGSISYPSPARQSDEMLHVLVGSKYFLNKNLVLNLNGIYNHNNENYEEPIDFIPTNLLYESSSYLINSQIEWSPISWDRLLGGVEYSGSWLDVNGISWGSPFLMNPTRVQKSAYISNELVHRNDSEWFGRISLYLTGRYDHYSDVIEDAFSPRFGINLQINKQYNIHLRSSWSKNFRVPTFNDLYYPMYSNPDVTPERSTAFDAGFAGNIGQSGEQTLQITYFDIVTKNKIVYAADYKPYNIGKAENSGLEIRYDYHSIDGEIEAYFGFTLIDAIKKDRISMTDSTYGKQLPYVPNSLGAFGLSVETFIGKININQSITSIRYTNSDNSNLLPAYALTDVNLAKKVALEFIQLTLRCAIINLFNTDYQTVEGYPTYGRAYKIGISIDY